MMCSCHYDDSGSDAGFGIADTPTGGRITAALPVERHLADTASGVSASSSDGCALGAGCVCRPRPPASGRNGRWEKLGEVGIDSAHCAITDPRILALGDIERREFPPRDVVYQAYDYGTGLEFHCGFGDGGYEVWAWVADYGQDDEVDERIAQIVVTFIDEKRLYDWHHPLGWGQ